MAKYVQTSDGEDLRLPEAGEGRKRQNQSVRGSENKAKEDTPVKKL